MKVNSRTAAAALLALLLAGATMAAQQTATSTTPTGGQSSTTSGQQQTAQPPAAPPDKNAPEISSQETAATFKVKVNLVEVRVVVRDAQGHAVGNLKQDDFQLFDNGKLQTITKFSVDQAGAKPVIHQEGGPPTIANDKLASLPTMPERFIAYLFDDIHLKFGDLAQVRSAAQHHLEELRSTDRAAIFTTSGQNQLDFTDDQAKLRAAMNQIQPRPVTGSVTADCPLVSYYMASLIVNGNDPTALNVVTQDALDCAYGGDPQFLNAAQQTARSSAFRELNVGNHETQVTLDSIKQVVRRITSMPGQRTIILVSPGFYNPDELFEQIAIAERALHANVIISALDARGLYTPGYLDAASQNRPPSPFIVGQMTQYENLEAQADANVLAELANATGGTFVQNTNDLAGGFHRLATTPEYSYLLGFSPQNLKLDGRFHNLKVTLKAEKFQIQARKEYYAPKQAEDASEQAKREVEDAVFSQEQVSDIPVQLHTQFFKSGEDAAQLSVLVRMDLRHLHYRKVDGRNHDDVTVVSAVFDRNGNFVSGNQKIIQMRLKDETLATKLNSGVTLKTSFDVKPGSYLVRLVVRDDEGQMATQNSAIEIP